MHLNDMQFEILESRPYYNRVFAFRGGALVHPRLAIQVEIVVHFKVYERVVRGTHCRWVTVVQVKVPQIVSHDVGEFVKRACQRQRFDV